MNRIAGIILTDTHLKEDNIQSNLDVYDQAIEFCLDNQIKTIFHGGDIFHSRKSQSQLILNTFNQILDKIHNNGLHMISIVGNHDKTDYDSKDSFLSPFIHHPGLTLIESGVTYNGEQLNMNEDCSMSFLSYFSEEIYLEHLNSLVEQLDSNKNNFLLTHIGVNGAVMNNGTKIESTIKTSHFKPFKDVYIGHYHDGQSWSNIHYIGASLQHNYGERTKKGFQILYSDGSIEFMPLYFPQYVKYNIDVTELTQKEIDEIKEIKEASSDHIKIVLIGEKKDLNDFNIQALKQAGVEVELKQKEIEVEELNQRIEPFTSQTLSDQFKIFCEKNSLDLQRGLVYFNKIVE